MLNKGLLILGQRHKDDADFQLVEFVRRSK